MHAIDNTINNNEQQILSKNNFFKNINHSIDQLHFGKYNILYLNINSLSDSKLHDLEVYLETISINNDVIIPQYNAYFSTRANGHGGCAVFIHDSLLCNCIYSNSDSNVNILMVNITNLKMNISVI